MKTRSRFGGVVLAAMMVGSLLLASCSATPPSPATSATDTKPSGTLNMAVNFGTGGILEAKGKTIATSAAFRTLGAAVLDSLVDLTPEGQLKPGLAERWEIAPDGLTHTFQIRKGVKFHDGSDLTGADVKFTVEAFLAAEGISGASTQSVWKAGLARVEVRDDYTVVFHLKAPRFELFTGIATLEGTGGVLPKKYIEEKGWDYFARKPIGSGPWQVVSIQANARLELEAVESHWRAVPKFKNLTLVNIGEEATKAAMLKTGELDMAVELSPDSVAALKAAGLRVLGYYGSAQFYAPMLWDTDNPEKYALSDVRVRKALSLDMDRKELAEKIYGGYAQPSAVTWVPAVAYFFDPSVLKPDPYDPDQAKKLLAEAGYANGFTTKIWDSGGGGILSNLNLALAGYWRKIGVNGEIVPVEYATVGRKFFNPTSPSPDAWNTFFPFIGSGGTFGFDRVVFYHSTKGILKTAKNPRLDELIDKVPVTADPGEKKRLALEAALLAKNGYTMIPGLDVDTLYAFGPKVGAVTPVKGVVGLAASYETITHAK